MRKISNVGLAQLVVIELDGAVSFNAILADIDADRKKGKKLAIPTIQHNGDAERWNKEWGYKL